MSSRMHPCLRSPRAAQLVLLAGPAGPASSGGTAGTASASKAHAFPPVAADME